MPFVKDVTLDGAKIVDPTWERIAEVLGNVFSNRRGFLQLLGEREAILTICPSEEYGCYVSAFGKNELAEYLLTDPILGMSPVETVLAGCSDTFPRCVFVDDSLVIRAAREFFNTGFRDNELYWANPFELYAEAGIK